MRNSYLPAVVDAKYVSDYQLDITFDDGTRKLVDVSQWFKGPVFEPLRKKSYFKKFFIEATSIAWPNGADIAPESLYEAQDLRKAEPKRSPRSRPT
jgi:hypothetical protein